MKNEWFTCPACGHKLFFIKTVANADEDTVVEKKCHSCRSVCEIIIRSGEIVPGRILKEGRKERMLGGRNNNKG